MLENLRSDREISRNWPKVRRALILLKTLALYKPFTYLLTNAREVKENFLSVYWGGGGMVPWAGSPGCFFWVLTMRSIPKLDQHRKRYYTTGVVRHWYDIANDEQQLHKISHWTGNFPIMGCHWTKRQRCREVTVSLAILNLVELNLHPRPCPRCRLFLKWKGTLISQPTNQPTNQPISLLLTTHLALCWSFVDCYGPCFMDFAAYEIIVNMSV